MGAKSFFGTTEMQRFFVLQDILNYFMKNCMVSMATVNVILKYGGVHTKLIISSLLLNMVSFESMDIGFSFDGK